MAANLWELQWHSHESQVSTVQSRLPQWAGIKQTRAIVLREAARPECCSLEPVISGTVLLEAGHCSGLTAHCCRADRCSLVCREANFSLISAGIYQQPVCAGRCQSGPAHWFNTHPVSAFCFGHCTRLWKWKGIRPSGRIQGAHSLVERLRSEQIALNNQSLFAHSPEATQGRLQPFPKGGTYVFFSFEIISNVKMLRDWCKDFLCILSPVVPVMSFSARGPHPGSLSCLVSFDALTLELLLSFSLTLGPWHFL